MSVRPRPIAAVLMALALGAAPAALAQEQAPATTGQTPAAAPPAASTAEPLPDIVLGKPDAKVEIVEYASMTCPHCASFHRTTFQELKKEYIDTGKARFVLREFPLDPWAAGVFMLARCSPNYYATVDLFFETQRQWAVQTDTLGEIRKIAQQAGVTGDKFTQCLTDQKLLDGINAVKDRGYRELGVDATPTLFVDGQKVDGERSIEALRTLIDTKLGS